MPLSLLEYGHQLSARPTAVLLIAHELWNTDTSEIEEVMYMPPAEGWKRNAQLARDRSPRRWMSAVGEVAA